MCVCGGGLHITVYLRKTQGSDSNLIHRGIHTNQITAASRKH